MALVEFRGIGKLFGGREGDEGAGTWALRDVDLSIDEGEFCAIIGPSGCGKSTLLRLVDGLLTPTEGEVVLRGERVEEPGADRGFVFQHSNLLPWRSAKKNVEFGLECAGVASKERSRIAQHYLEMVGLSGFEDHYPTELSGGMQQRVGLARAYAIEPQILLMDEPFGAVDAQTRMTLQLELERIWEKDKRTAILVTHDMEEAVFLADRIAIMGSHPGYIAQTINVPFPRPRTDDLRREAKFAELRGVVWEGLQAASKPNSTSAQAQA